MRDLETNAHTCTNRKRQTRPHRALSPCQKNPGRGLWAVRTETDRLSHTPLSRDGWWEFPYRSLRPTQTVKKQATSHTGTSCPAAGAWSAVLTQCEKDSPSSMGSSMTWCPLICGQTRFSSEGASAATNLHRHSSFLAELDCDTGWCAPTRTALKLIPQTKLVTCKKPTKNTKTKVLSLF